MRKIRLLLFWFSLALTLLFGLWGSLRTPRHAQERALRLVEANTPQTVLGKWTIRLETPNFLRVGNAELVRLSLLPIEELPSTPEGPTISALPGDVLLPTLVSTTGLAVEARLDLAGVEVHPDQAITEPLSAGKPLTFFWSVRALQPGAYHGVAWLHLILLNTDSERRIPLSAQEIRLEVRTLWGLSATTARWLSLLWGALTFFFGFPYLKELLFWVQRKVQSRVSEKKG